jgi:hypothetical protein
MQNLKKNLAFRRVELGELEENEIKLAPIYCYLASMKMHGWSIGTCNDWYMDRHPSSVSSIKQLVDLIIPNSRWNERHVNLLSTPIESCIKGGSHHIGFFHYCTFQVDYIKRSHRILYHFFISKSDTVTGLICPCKVIDKLRRQWLLYSRWSRISSLFFQQMIWSFENDSRKKLC